MADGDIWRGYSPLLLLPPGVPEVPGGGGGWRLPPLHLTRRWRSARCSCRCCLLSSSAVSVSASLASSSWSAATVAAAVLDRLSMSGALLEDEEQSSGGACTEAGPGPPLAGDSGPDWRRAIASSSGVRRLLPGVVVVAGAILVVLEK